MLNYSSTLTHEYYCITVFWSQYKQTVYSLIKQGNQYIATHLKLGNLKLIYFCLNLLNLTKVWYM